MKSYFALLVTLVLAYTGMPAASSPPRRFVIPVLPDPIDTKMLARTAIESRASAFVMIARPVSLGWAPGFSGGSHLSFQEVTYSVVRVLKGPALSAGAK